MCVCVDSWWFGWLVVVLGNMPRLVGGGGACGGWSADPCLGRMAPPRRPAERRLPTAWVAGDGGGGGGGVGGRRR